MPQHVYYSSLAFQRKAGLPWVDVGPAARQRHKRGASRHTLGHSHRQRLVDELGIAGLDDRDHLVKEHLITCR